MLSILANSLHSALVSGALQKGGAWGGPECRIAVPPAVHLYESTAWLALSIVAVIIFRPFKKLQRLNKHVRKDLEDNILGKEQRLVETAIGVIHLLLFCQIIIYKINISSMINLIQP
jgi:hypothetical protein